MASKYVKKCSKSVIIKKTKIETAIKYYLTQVKMLIKSSLAG